MASLVLPAASVSKTNNRRQPICFCQSSNAVSFQFPSHSKPKLGFSAKGLRSNTNHSTLVKAQLNEVTGNGSANVTATHALKTEGPKLEKKDAEQADETSSAALASEASISEFMAQVSNLVKLVDSRDVVELQLKQSDCELVIRKKEALPQPSSPDNMVMMHSAPSAAVTPPAFPPAPSAPAVSAPTPAPVTTQAPSPSPPAGKPKSSHPPLICPMAGTFYRCPAPGEPPFVKVGDKVQKGQIVCVIEAMKLMNEIEADRTGKIVEILVDDGKPVSVDTPLFVIEP